MQRREFMSKAATLVALSPICKVKSFVLANNSEASDLIKQWSIAAFERFSSVWDFNDFWKRGNTFDACLTFADALHSRFPDDAHVQAMQGRIGEMLEENYHYFKSLNPDGMWADDFGWWGLMGLNARKYLLRLGNIDLADKYLDLSMNLCWKQERDHAYDKTTTARPVPHGCTNSAANGQSNGVKNTVTNVLFFLLSIRHYRLSLAENRTDGDPFLEMAYRQWIWFDSWFKLKKYEYLKIVSTGSALVQERPTAFFDGSDYKDITHPTWEKDWIWTGDQGMLLAALGDMLAIKTNLAAWLKKNKPTKSFDVNDFEKTIRAYIYLISNGIKIGLVGGEDKIIREAPFQANFGPEFGRDYLAGRGIMMRYLGKVNMQISGVNFSDNIRATATAIWETRDKATNQFQPEFTRIADDKSYIDKFRKLTAAGDEVFTWDIATMDKQQKDGVCQSIGLDAMGAYLNTL